MPAWERSWSVPLGYTSAAMVPAGCKSLCVKKGTGWAANTTGAAPIWQIRTYRIQGMTCEACAHRVEQAVQ